MKSNPEITDEMVYSHLTYELLHSVLGKRLTTARGRPYSLLRFDKKKNIAVIRTHGRGEITFKISNVQKCVEHLFTSDEDIEGVTSKSNTSIKEIVGDESLVSFSYVWGIIAELKYVKKYPRALLKGKKEDRQTLEEIRKELEGY